MEQNVDLDSAAPRSDASPTYLELLAVAEHAHAATPHRRGKVAKRSQRLRSAIVLLLVLVAVEANWGVGRHLIRNAPSAEESLDEAADVEVGTATFHLTFPAQPSVERFTQTILGVSASATAWEVESGDLLLSVLAIDLGPTLPTGWNIDGAFDGLVTGLVQRSGGTVVIDEDFLLSGVPARRTEIHAKGLRLYHTSVAIGSTVLSIGGGSTALWQPSEYTELVASLELD